VRTCRFHPVILAALAISVILALVAAPAGAGTSPSLRGHLDTSFGEGGVLEVKSELSEGRELGQVAPTVGGPIYFTEDTYVCRDGDRAPCRNQERLRRFEPDGAVDPSYAPGSDVFPGLEQEVDLIADSNGLPVFGWTRHRRVFVRRLLPTGSPDPAFGAGGTVRLDCRCTLEGLEPTEDGGVVISAFLRRNRQHAGGKAQPLTFVFERLRADGSPDPHFAHGGIALVHANNWAGALATPDRGAGLLLTGQFRSFRESGPNYFATRLSPHGALDRPFGRAAVAAARGAYGRDGFLWEELIAFPRKRGMELFATTSYGKSLALRLRANGRVDPTFGHHGEALIALDGASAADAGEGRLFVVGNRGYKWSVQLVDADGRRDRGFGSLVLPEGGSEYGLWIYPDGPGQAIVVSPGETVCREECPSEPRMYRVLD
jgi:hypothetical protein